MGSDRAAARAGDSSTKPSISLSARRSPLRVGLGGRPEAVRLPPSPAAGALAAAASLARGGAGDSGLAGGGVTGAGSARGGTGAGGKASAPCAAELEEDRKPGIGGGAISGLDGAGGLGGERWETRGTSPGRGADSEAATAEDRAAEAGWLSGLTAGRFGSSAPFWISRIKSCR